MSELQNPALYLLASLLSSCPEPARWLEELPLLRNDNTGNGRHSEALADPLAEWLSDLNEERLWALHSEYIDIFDRQHVANPIYETEYGRNRSISKATELADLAGFYRAFGLDPDGIPEMPDHFAVELEFYAYLLMKQQLLQDLHDADGVAIVAQARQHFLRDHLGGFAKAMAASEGTQAHPFYGPLFQWTGQLVTAACRTLDVDPAPIAYFSREQEAEGFDCATLGSCPVVQAAQKSAEQAEGA
ncbi:MAG: hypothetical protein CVV27_12430 [Candidatus Melainabacteria bacterium HGW-Melainabacteria-1]|nr:MAG: hypothetical protein CVV27_12430 [Candidatus Melainabacteria bacterium HGW-Melainabacteria-1]